MDKNEQDEVIVDDVEETNEEVTEETEEASTKVDKPKRTPQEELEYFEGRAERLRKKLGVKEEVEPKKSTQTEKPSELDYGQMALLRQEGIKGAGETALFKEIMSEMGKGVLDVLDSNYFKSRLTDFREAQESLDAIPKGKNRSGQQGITDTDVAVAKFKETGKLPEDFKTRVAVKNAMVAEEQNKNMFTGPSVIGPRAESY